MVFLSTLFGLLAGEPKSFSLNDNGPQATGHLSLTTLAIAIGGAVLVAGILMLAWRINEKNSKKKKHRHKHSHHRQYRSPVAYIRHKYHKFQYNRHRKKQKANSHVKVGYLFETPDTTAEDPHNSHSAHYEQKRAAVEERGNTESPMFSEPAEEPVKETVETTAEETAETAGSVD